MIQLNFTLFIQLINFLLLLVILNAILYKPILAKIREREARIKGDRDKAKELAEKIDVEEGRHQQQLATARQTAAQYKAALLAEAKKKEAHVLEAAKADAGRIVEDMKKAIQADAEEVRKTLQTQMTPLAQSIAQKLLGRAV